MDKRITYRPSVVDEFLADLREDLTKKLYKRGYYSKRDFLFLRNITNQALCVRSITNPINISLEELNDSILGAAVIIAATGGYRLNTEISGSGISELDLPAYRGMMTNLISNACKFSSNGAALVKIIIKKRIMTVMVTNKLSDTISLYAPYSLGLTAASACAEYGGGGLCRFIEKDRITFAANLPLVFSEKPCVCTPASYEYLTDRFSELHVGLAEISGMPDYKI